ncbi:MAG: hypothetical protein H6732_15095 [Alphaproteobacteria bacterium]|nr:hypothetical protein [Alphaproteobacteria bacterium]
MRALLPLLLLACGTSSPDTGDTDADTDATVDTDADDGTPSIVDCPGGPGCADSDDRTLRAGVAVRDANPACYESWIDHNGNFTFQRGIDELLDCGCDRLCPGDAGYTGPDEGEGDGVPRWIWVAGYQNNKPAMGVRGADQGLMGEGDGLEVRALVLDQGQTRIALVTIDAIGWMHDDNLRRREKVIAAGLDVDHVIITSSHSHAAPDSMGIYGRTQSDGGYDLDYALQVDDAVVAAVTEAVAGLTEVTMSITEIDTNTKFPNGVANLINDSRDPWIVDPRVGVIQLADQGGAPVATVVHWANHPESFGDDNAMISAGFVHPLRTGIESGTKWKDGSGKPGIGGTVLYVQGTVGGMMTSLGTSVVDPTGAVWNRSSFEREDAVGMLVAELVLEGLPGLKPVSEPRLAVAAELVYLPVVNIGFQAMFSLGVFEHRTAWNYDAEQVVDDENQPDIRTEVDVLDLGPVRMLTIPGELFPENAIGGYDGKWLPPTGATLVDERNPNPPDLTQAPSGPYLLDELGGEMNWILGLGMDEVGYLIPPYNFKLGPAPYLAEAEGDHYEETNSLGPDTWPILEAAARELLTYVDAKSEE